MMSSIELRKSLLSIFSINDGKVESLCSSFSTTDVKGLHTPVSRAGFV